MKAWTSTVLTRWRASGNWADDLDFGGPRARTAWWAWLVLGLGVATALKVSDEFDRVRLALDDGEVQMKRLNRAERQRLLAQGLSVRQVAAASSEKSAPALSGPALTDAMTMSLLLAYPWGQVLAQLESQAAAHQAVMMSMGADLAGLNDAAASQPVWRLQAAVHGDGDAMAWAFSLPQGRLLTRERLPQPFTGLTGAYEFKVQVQMTPTARSPSPTLAAKS